MPLWLTGCNMANISNFSVEKSPSDELSEELCCDQWSWPTGHPRSHVCMVCSLNRLQIFPLHPIRVTDKEKDIKAHPLPPSFLFSLFSSLLPLSSPKAICKLIRDVRIRDFRNKYSSISSVISRCHLHAFVVFQLQGYISPTLSLATSKR